MYCKPIFLYPGRYFNFYYVFSNSDCQNVKVRAISLCQQQTGIFCARVRKLLVSNDYKSVAIRVQFIVERQAFNLALSCVFCTHPVSGFSRLLCVLARGMLQRALNLVQVCETVSCCQLCCNTLICKIAGHRSGPLTAVSTV